MFPNTGRKEHHTYCCTQRRSSCLTERQITVSIGAPAVDELFLLSAWCQILSTTRSASFASKGTFPGRSTVHGWRSLTTVLMARQAHFYKTFKGNTFVSVFVWSTNPSFSSVHSLVIFPRVTWYEESVQILQTWNSSSYHGIFYSSRYKCIFRKEADSLLITTSYLSSLTLAFQRQTKKKSTNIEKLITWLILRCKSKYTLRKIQKNIFREFRKNDITYLVVRVHSYFAILLSFAGCVSNLPLPWTGGTRI